MTDAIDIVISDIRTLIAQLRAANRDQVEILWEKIDARLGNAYRFVRQATSKWGPISPHPQQAPIDWTYLALRDAVGTGLAGNWNSASKKAEGALRVFEEAQKPARTEGGVRVMSSAGHLGLKLVVWNRDGLADGEEGPIIYAVSGLSSADNCAIVNAGTGDDGNKKWHFHWYRSGKRLHVSEDAYHSPEEALEAIAKLREKLGDQIL